MIQLSVVVQNNLNPILARELAAGRTGEVATIVRGTRRWFVPLFVFACVAAAASYPFVVPWLIGNRVFVDGAAPFAILLAGAALCAAYLPFNTVLLMAGLPGQQTVFVCLMLGTNFVLNLLLVPPLGTQGAAIASAIAISSSALSLRYLVRAKTGARI